MNKRFKVLIMVSRLHGRCPEAVEAEHVYQVYDEIASHFSHTRYKPWPRVASFLDNLPNSSIVADIGCGNGKYLGCGSLNGIYLHGSDRCRELIEIAKKRQHDVCLADNFVLPYRDMCFDAVISIAVIHHFASETRRLLALQELTRVIRIGGQLLIYVWALEQKRKTFSQQDVFVPWHLQQQFARPVKFEQTTAVLSSDETRLCESQAPMQSSSSVSEGNHCSEKIVENGR
ncbi:probable tRNA methyltransferase 9B isoform X2 [Corticium candelabrum]|uniref:probable tRNA methyltransferase 9B isoform X2 n=1 Tax=Corticium candelabrum TaxID=121492 RepID=UPI002E261B0C|nr:probable tRNA methyltransferase 9B isoform X2 [Corticium candelabrum]